MRKSFLFLISKVSKKLNPRPLICFFLIETRKNSSDSNQNWNFRTLLVPLKIRTESFIRYTQLGPTLLSNTVFSRKLGTVAVKWRESKLMRGFCLKKHKCAAFYSMRIGDA